MIPRRQKSAAADKLTPDSSAGWMPERTLGELGDRWILYPFFTDEALAFMNDEPTGVFTDLEFESFLSRCPNDALYNRPALLTAEVTAHTEESGLLAIDRVFKLVNMGHKQFTNSGSPPVSEEGRRRAAVDLFAQTEWGYFQASRSNSRLNKAMRNTKSSPEVVEAISRAENGEVALEDLFQLLTEYPDMLSADLYNYNQPFDKLANQSANDHILSTVESFAINHEGDDVDQVDFIGQGEDCILEDTLDSRTGVRVQKRLLATIYCRSDNPPIQVVSKNTYLRVYDDGDEGVFVDHPLSAGAYVRSLHSKEAVVSSSRWQSLGVAASRLLALVRRS